jgi:hypothetical protein
MKKTLKIALMLTGVMSGWITFSAKADCGCTCDQVGIIETCIQFDDGTCVDVADSACYP